MRAPTVFSSSSRRATRSSSRAARARFSRASAPARWSTSMSRRSTLAAGLALFLTAVTFAACRQDMHDSPRFRPYRASDLYADGSSARPLVDGTVARGHLNDDDLLYTGRVNGQISALFPFAITRADLDRGQE